MSGSPPFIPADETLWDIQNRTLWDTVEPPTYWSAVLAILQVFFPQYFDPDSPSYVDPILLQNLLAISNEARPWCLSTNRQNFAQAMFLAYLISVQQETSTGQQLPSYAGPISSEKEGDIQVSYAAVTNTSDSQSKRPSSNPWDAWNKLWSVCQRGAITTRFGDPCQSASQIQTTALSVLNWISKPYGVAG